MVIGMEGKNIRQVECETNTSIKVLKRGHTRFNEDAKVTILGSEQNCKKALCIIHANLDKKISQVLATTETITIPNQMVGRVIGKGGLILNAIEKLSGAQVEIERKGLGAQRNCKMTGMAEEIEKAKEWIQRAIKGVDVVQKATLATMVKFEEKASLAEIMAKLEEMGFLVFPVVDEK